MPNTNIVFSFRYKDMKRNHVAKSRQVSVTRDILPVMVLLSDLPKDRLWAAEYLYPQMLAKGSMPCLAESTRPRYEPSGTARRHSSFHEAVSC